jgi:nicotinamidase-related amidase
LKRNVWLCSCITLSQKVLVDKLGCGAFYQTDIEIMLRTSGFTWLVLTGETTDICVHPTL